MFTPPRHRSTPFSALAAVVLALVTSASLATAQSKAIPCPDFGDRAPWQWRLRAYGGGGSTDLTYETPAPGLGLYRNHRDGYEDLLITPRAGVRAEASRPGGFSARAGVTYHNYRSRTRVFSDLPPDILPPQPRVTEIDNRHHTAALSAGVGFHRWLWNRVAPYVYAEAGYEFRVATRGALPSPAFVSGSLPTVAVDSEPFIARAPGLQYGVTAGLDLAIGERYFIGGSLGYDFLNGLDSADDPLDYDQRALTAAINVGLRL